MRTSVLMMGAATAALMHSGIAFAIGHANDGRDLRQHVTNDMTLGHLGHANDGSGISGAGSGHASNDTVMGSDDAGARLASNGHASGTPGDNAGARPLSDDDPVVSRR